MCALKYDMTGWKMWEHGVPDSKIEVISKVVQQIYGYVNAMYVALLKK